MPGLAPGILLSYVALMSLTPNSTSTNPRPSQGVGKFGRSRLARTEEIAGSNPAALTIVYLPPLMYDRAKERGVDMRGYAKQQPIPQQR